MSLRIAFVGPLKAGKTTASKYLASRYGTKTVTFSNPLKEELFAWLQSYRIASMHSKAARDNFVMKYQEVFNKGPCLGEIPLPPLGNYNDPIGWINKNKDEVRPLLQWWGTDFKRAQDNQYWIRMLKATMDAYAEEQGHNNFTNDDCRFVNEAAFFVENGFTIVAINPLTAEEAKGLHASETDHVEILKHFPHIVVHNPKTSFGEFYDKLDTALYKAGLITRPVEQAAWGELLGS